MSRARGRLVEQHELGIVHQRPADRDALALAAGQLGRRFLARSVRPSSSSSWSARSASVRRRCGAELVDDEEVLPGGEERHQVDRLEDEADHVAGGTR